MPRKSFSGRLSRAASLSLPRGCIGKIFPLQVKPFAQHDQGYHAKNLHIAIACIWHRCCPKRAATDDKWHSQDRRAVSLE
jgi:hypothetical protein